MPTEPVSSLSRLSRRAWCPWWPSWPGVTPSTWSCRSFLVFAALDGAFLSSVLTKVPDGAWFTLMLAVILSAIFVLWRFGKEAQWKAESANRVPPSALLTSTGRLTPSFGGLPISVVPGLGIFDKKGDVAFLPQSFSQFVAKFAAAPRSSSSSTCGLCLCPRSTRASATSSRAWPAWPPPTPLSCATATWTTCSARGLSRELVTEIELMLSRHPEANGDELAALRAAENSQMVYVLGKEVMRIHRGSGGIWAFFRRRLLTIFLWIRENSRAKLADLDIDVDRLIEVGFVKEI